MKDPVLRSGVSSLFVQPLYPKRGEEVCFRAMADPKRVKWVRITTIQNDNLERYPMTKASGDGPYDIHEVRIRVDEKELRYWFEAELVDGTDCYLSKAGLSDYLCPWENAFVLKYDLDVPSWVPSSVCYQIFPDRFCRGNKELGAREGDYEFDGHPIREMNWDDKPLPYSEGYCLDFFNGDLAGIASKAEYLRGL